MTIGHVYNISTAILKDVAGAVIFIAIVLVAAAWFAGPARPAYATRHAIAPFLREQAVATYGIVLGLMVLLFIWNPIPATGKPLGILVFTVLALFGTYILIQQTAHEFPEARSGAATQAIRTRVASMRERRHALGRLIGSCRIHDRRAARPARRPARPGRNKPEEYQSAKEKLLNA